MKKKTFPLSTIWKYNENNNYKKRVMMRGNSPLNPLQKE
jgi:hypothetical protein